MTMLLRLTGIGKAFGGPRRWLGTTPPAVTVLRGVDLVMNAGERLGVVGESGSGKTTLARIVLGLTPASAGRIELLDRDVTALGRPEIAHIRRHVQMVFQDPLSSLNPRKTVAEIIELPLAAQGAHGRAVRRARVRQLLGLVGLGERHAEALPAQLSGGQRQRVGIARALAIEPRLVLLDEPTASLDVSVQARILALLARLQRETGVAQLIISHNLGVIRHAADRIVVMYMGEIVEAGAVEQVYGAPAHPYTRALFSAMPVLDRRERALMPAREPLRGEVGSIARRPSGCAFHPRCPKAMDVCARGAPPETQISPSQIVRCHLHGAGIPA